jgi:hypothetical protein
MTPARATLADRRRLPQDATGVRSILDEDARVVLSDLSEAMKETGWTQEALATWFKERDVRSTDRQYVGKMLSGEKPITLRDIVAFPDDLEAAFVRRWNQKFAATEQQAIGRLLTAVGEVLAVCQLRQLPLRARAMAKAELK